MKTPDFAFPKTVSETAIKDYEVAVGDNDAHAALNALIRYTVAETQIDIESLTDEIRLVEEATRIFKDDRLYGLYPALLANLYNTYYRINQWIYNQRQLPLEPYPADLSEWSGEQFRAKIQALCDQSIADECISQLTLCPIGEYSDIITTDELTRVYYPTLADFVYQNAASIVSLNDSGHESAIYKKALTHSAKDSAQSLLWTTRLKINDASEALDIMAEYANNPYAGLLFDQLEIKRDGYTDDFKSEKRYIEMAELYLAQFSNTPFRNGILNRISEFLSADISIEFPSVCAPSAPFEIKIKNTNSNSYKVDIYFIGDKELDGRQLKTKIKSSNPTKTLTFNSDLAKPFYKVDTAQIACDKPGYYVILPKLKNGGDDDHYWNRTFRCIPVYPVSISSNDNNLVAVTSPTNGKPIDGAVVSITDRKGKSHGTAKTDANGLAKVDGLYGAEDYGTLNITYQGKSYEISGLYMRKDTSTPDTSVQLTANILTDRAIYHPGDNVHVLAIVSSGKTNADKKYESSLCENMQVRIGLFDANNELVDTTTVVTDNFGRGIASFTLPTDGLTGNYSISVFDPKYGSDKKILIYSGYFIGRRSIMVSDYKMPDFEVKLDPVKCDVPQKGQATVGGTALSYSGMPIAGARITLNMISTPFWYRYYFSNNDAATYNTEVTTDADGHFNVAIPDSVLTNKDLLYVVSIDAVSPTGTTAQASTTFAMTARYRIEVNVSNKNVNGELPFNPNVKVYDAEGNEAELPLNWQLTKLENDDNKVIAQGKLSGHIDLSGITPGTYNFVVSAEDTELAQPQTTSITIYNKSTGIVPDDAVLWAPQTSFENGGEGQFQIDFANARDIYLYVYQLDDLGNATVSVQQFKAGYNTLDINLPQGVVNTKVTAMTVCDFHTYEQTFDLTHKVDNSLKIVGESFRDNLIPQSNETWRIRITNADGTPVGAALALDMYNKALDAIYPNNQYLAFPSAKWSNNIMTRFNNLDTRYVFVRQNERSLPTQDFVQPMFNFYGYRYLTFGLNNRFSRSPKMGVSSVKYSLSSVKEECADFDEAPMEMASMIADNIVISDDSDEMTAGNAVESAASPAEDFDYRDSDVPLAIWAPTLTTDAEGNISYSFTVPNANTTWRLQAVAWSQDMKVGRMMRDFVASKPIMVQPNLPRFLRNGDRATILAAVMNNSDTVQNVTVTIEIFDPLTSAVTETRTTQLTLQPKESQNVSIDVEVGMDATALGYRVRCTNGTYGDGEQNVIRVLPNISSLIETTPFYLNPGDTKYSTKLPKGKDTRITLTFCENPAWTVVTALPGLRTQISEYANSAAAALFSAAVAHGIIKDNPTIGEAIKVWQSNPTDSVLVSMLQKNEDLKLAVLNCTPWVQAANSDTQRMANLAMIFDNNETESSINAALKILEDLQNKDGGWTWAKWSKESSLWVTSNVLSMFADLNRNGWLPQDKRLEKMIVRALGYYDKTVEKTDLLYTIIRAQLGGQPISANGNKVIEATIADIRQNWKSYTDPAYKAMAAEALWLHGEEDTANELMRSLSEFSVWTRNQGLKFPSVNALYNYAIILEAYAMIQPDSQEVDGLRQQLIVRKQGTDWGDAVVTTEVVQSILSTGTRYTVEAKGAEVTVGDRAIEPQGEIEKYTGSLRADLSGYAGKELTVTTSGAGPAYGAVYAQYKKQMDHVKTASCDDLSIEKQLFVRRGDSWEHADKLKVGDRVKVQLTIHCKRNLQYVSIVDERPATFEPVDQIPGWLWSEGVGFYRENRDSQTDLHVIYMRPGTYLLTYEMNVNLAGEFTTGVATIQSQYAPEISAHSSGTKIAVNH